MCVINYTRTSSLKTEQVPTICKCDLHSRYPFCFFDYLLRLDVVLQFLPASVAVIMLAKRQKSAYCLPVFEFKFFRQKVPRLRKSVNSGD